MLQKIKSLSRKGVAFFKKLTSNEYVFSVIAKLFGVGAGFLFSILYRRYFGAELTGQAAVIRNQATMAELILCFGIYQAYPYFRRQGIKPPEQLYQEFIDKSFGIFFLYCLISGLLCLLPVHTETKIVFILVPLMVAVKLLNYVVLIERPKLRNMVSIILNLVDIVMILILSCVVKASFALICGFLIFKDLVYFVIAVQNLKVPLLKIRPTLKGVWPYVRFGFVPMLTIILMEINYKVDVLMLDGRVSDADIGVYTLGVQLAERMWLIPEALKDILLSKLSKGKGVDEVAKVTRISLALMILCIVALALLGRPIIDLFFGAEYSEAYQVMLVILASVISMVFYKTIYVYNVAHGKRAVNMIILGIAAVLNVGLNALLIPIMGIYGAAVASLASYTVCGLAFLIYFHHEAAVPYRKIILLKKQDLHLLKTALLGRGKKKAGPKTGDPKPETEPKQEAEPEAETEPDDP